VVEHLHPILRGNEFTTTKSMAGMSALGKDHPNLESPLPCGQDGRKPQQP